MCIYCNFLWKELYHLGLYCFLIWGYTGKEINWIHSCAFLTKITLYIPTCPILLQLLLFSLSVKTCFYVWQLLIAMFLLVDGWIFLDRHHVWRSLDPTLDISPNFVKKEKERILPPFFLLHHFLLKKTKLFIKMHIFFCIWLCARLSAPFF